MSTTEVHVSGRDELTVSADGGMLPLELYLTGADARVLLEQLRVGIAALKAQA